MAFSFTSLPECDLVVQLIFRYLYAAELCHFTQALCLSKRKQDGRCVETIIKESEQAWKSLLAKDFYLFSLHIRKGPNSVFWPLKLADGSLKRKRKLPDRYNGYIMMRSSTSSDKYAKTGKYVKADENMSYYEIYKLTVMGKLHYWVQVRNPYESSEYTLSAYDAIVSHVPNTELNTGLKSSSKFNCYYPSDQSTSWKVNYRKLRFPLEGSFAGGNPFLKQKGNLKNNTPWCVCADVGLSDISSNQNVEVQWRLQEEGAFGWWKTKVIEVDETHVTFLNDHFDETSPWRVVAVNWLDVNEDGSKNDPVAGFIGGIIPINPEQIREWLPFYPDQTTSE